MWEEVAGLAGGMWVMPDLPGHGDEPVADWEGAVAGVAARVAAAGDPVLAGYSMGGRLALAAVLAGSRPRALVIVSASAGIADAAARERRRVEDEQTAARLERLGVELFVDEWLSRDLFAGLGGRPAAWGRADRRMRLSNSGAGLAGALRKLGQGSQPYLGDRVAEIEIPMVAIAGERDDRYARLAARFGAGAPRGSDRVVPSVGHAVVAEAPKAVAEVVASLLGS
jgi:2-succinyl-6-hydroxy-2,4-cyclohexadiene-1-carboxylate synthase